MVCSEKCLAFPNRLFYTSVVALGPGRSWAEICNELKLSKGTAQRAFLGLPKNPLFLDTRTSSCLVLETWVPFAGGHGTPI